MDNQRLLVWATFGILLWFTYQTWLQDYGPKPVLVEQQSTTTPPPDAAIPAEDQLSLPELGSVGGDAEEPGAALPARASARSPAATSGK